jgi:hypothetical protein
MIGATNPE